MSVTSSKVSFSLNSFQIDESSYFIATECCEIPSVDLLKLLSELKLYPKAFWQFRNSRGKKEAFAGSLIDFDRAPSVGHLETIQGQKIQIKAFGQEVFNEKNPKPTLCPPFDKPYYFIPEIEIIQSEKQTVLYRHQITDSTLNLPSFSPFELPALSLWPDLPVIQSTGKHSLNRSEWTQAVNDLVQKMKKGPLKKVVLSRVTSLKNARMMDPFKLLNHLKSSFLNSTFFCLQRESGQAFCGASPEILYTQDQDHLSTEALAGTCKIQESKNLLQSFKELDEFKYVTDFFNSQLKKITLNYQQHELQERSTGYLKHLYSGFLGQLKPNVNHSEIVKTLFPSPALCGTPQNLALKAISEIEPLSRGWFAAPIGWTGEESAEFAIAIRSCYIHQDQVHLFVGSGITSNSHPELEWDELDNKMQPFFEVFGYES